MADRYISAMFYENTFDLIEKKVMCNYGIFILKACPICLVQYTSYTEWVRVTDH